METISLVVFLFFVVLIGALLQKFLSFIEVPPLPKLQNIWWSDGPEIEDTSVNPYVIRVPKQVIDDLKSRLKNIRKLTPPLEGIQQQYGISSKALKPILDYWKNVYDWPSRERYLNQFPQFKTNIQGLNVHFIHVKHVTPTGTPVLPLLMVHGFLGSFREFYKIIPTLIKVHEIYGFAFEIVAPTLPGFGFSDGATKPGFGVVQICLILKKLMLRLGHKKFYLHGGNFGSSVITQMATLFPQHISGLHTIDPFIMGKENIVKVIITSLLQLVLPKEYTKELRAFSKSIKNYMLENGCFHIQATKPDTIGVGMNDCPAGLAAFMFEKISTLTNIDYIERDDAGLLEKYTYDELLDLLMFFWIPQSFTTSNRLYAECYSKEDLDLQENFISINVPCAVARFPHTGYHPPDWMLKDKYTNLIHTTDFEEGGIFAAYEFPEVLTEDIFKAVNKMRRLRKTNL